MDLWQWPVGLARRDHLDCVDLRLRRPERRGRLRGLEGWRRRHDLAGHARIGLVRHPRRRHRTGLFGIATLFAMERNLDSRLAHSMPFPPRFGDPSEFAMLVMHVIRNVMINGTVLRLDGGYHR